MNIKKIFMLSILLLWTSISYAQKGTFKVDVAGGFELAEKEKLDIKGANGFDVNVDFKYYVHDRIYALGTVFSSRLSGTESCIIENGELRQDGENYRKMTNTMVGLGLGYDFLRVKRHTLYIQAAFGLSSEDYSYEQRYDSDHNPDNGYMISESDSSNGTDWGLIGKLGYNYQLTSWLSAGVSYQVNYLNWYVSQGFQGGFQISF